MKLHLMTFILLSLLLFSISCTPQLHETKKTETLMGTIVTITVYHENQETANKAINAAFSEIKRIDNLLSNYNENSEVSILNTNGTLANPSYDLLTNLKKSHYYSVLSNGAFDITVQPILDLYKTSFSQNNQPPSEEEINEELKKVDFQKITITEKQISLAKDQKITLGGIAKGYAVDRAIEILKSNGITNALVNAGGDMKAIGKKRSNQDWTIALANPRDKNDYISLIKLSDEAVVTSGDYERYFDPNKEFHHIVNPKTGYSATELISVTIIADNAFDSDAISTSVFVLGKDKGLELIENLPNVEGLVITRDREVIRSSGFPK